MLPGSNKMMMMMMMYYCSLSFLCDRLTCSIQHICRWFVYISRHLRCRTWCHITICFWCIMYADDLLI